MAIQIRAVRRVGASIVTDWLPTPPARGFDQYPGYSGDVAGSGLTDLGGATITGNNVTVENSKNFLLGSTGNPLTGTTTVRGCLFEENGPNQACLAPAVAGDLVLEYCTFRPIGLTDHTVPVDYDDGYQYSIACDGSSASPGTWNGFCDGTFTARNCHLWGFANATKESGTAPREWYDSIIENPRLNNNPLFDDHTDGLGAPGGGALDYYRVDGCWIYSSTADTNAIALQNTSGGQFDHVTITDCVFGGYGNTINIQNGTYPTVLAPNYLTFTNNILHCSYPPILTPLYDTLVVQGTGTVWSGNKVYVPEGATFGDHDTQDGLFWMPVSTNISGTGAAALAPYVSATDYM